MSNPHRLLTRLLAGLLLGTVGAYLVVTWQLPMPQCGMRTFIGIPCPFCGSTRCLAAIARGELAEAFRLNPLTFLGSAGIVVWTVLAFAERRLGWQWSVSWLASIRRALAHLDSPGERYQAPSTPWAPARGEGKKIGVASLMVAVLANWIYLCCTLP